MGYTLINRDLTPTTGDQLQQIINGIYADIHVHDNSTAQTIPTGLGYTKLNQFMDNGLSNGATPDHTNDNIVVPITARYKAECSISYKASVQNTVLYCSVFVNGVEQDQAHFTRKIGTAGDVGSSSITGYVEANANDDIDIRVRHDQGGNVDITVEYGNFNVAFAGL